MSRERGGHGIEFKYRAADAPPSAHPPPPSGYSYFTEQAIRAGYIPTGIGRIPDNIQNPPLDREAIEKELEKERIREKIIVSEIAQLEAQVGREIMLERELALQGRRYNVFDRSSFLLGAGMGFEPSDLSFGRVKGWPLEERLGNGTRHELGCRNVVHFEERRVEPKIGAGHDMIPFQQRAIEPKIEKVSLTSEVSKSKEKIFVLATPEQNLFGVKRKSLALTEEGKSELPSIEISKKKVKKEWSCAYKSELSQFWKERM